MLTLMIILLFIFVVGLCIGSFLNVVILRALSNESIVFPASKCPKCQTPLKWWHNIPVLSYIFLRGKCAFCKEHISIQYPLIELFTGIMFVIMFLRFGFDITTIYAWIVTSLLIVLAGTDIKQRVVFTKHTAALISVGFIYAFYATLAEYWKIESGLDVPGFTLLSNPLVNGILGSILGVIIMEALARLGYLFVGSRAFGEGDTLIAAGLGMIFGWENLIIVLICSVIIQVLLYLPLFLINLVRQKNWATLTSFLAFVVYAIGFVILRNLNLLKPISLYTLCSILLAVLGVLSCVLILKGLRKNPSERTYMPFGPAMVLAAFVVMLF